jgi:tetratricopeptide (TPR) repeat protein
MGKKISAIYIVLLTCALLFASCKASPESRAKKHVMRGDKYLSQEQFREALIEYKNAVDALPDNPDLRWKLANAAIEARDHRTAMSELQILVELDPENLYAKGKLGEYYLAMRKGEEVKKIADELVVVRPDDPRGYILQYGDIDEAMRKLEKALELDPNNGALILQMGNYYVLERNREKARYWYDRALSADPDSVAVSLTRGKFFFATGSFEEGEKEYKRAIELSEKDEAIRLALIQQYFSYGKSSKAETELVSLIGEENSQRARKILAEFKLETGKIVEAKGLVDEILSQRKNDIGGMLLKGRIALAENRLNEAKLILGEVVRKNPDMASARLYNGLTEIKMGNIEVGKKELLEGVRLDPDNTKAHLVLGDIYIKLHEPKLAEKEAFEVLRRNPTSIEASIIYADSFLLRKDWGKAEQIYEAMIKQLPENPQGYFKMGVSRKLQGKKEEAVKYFSRAFEKSPENLNIINEYVISLLSVKKPTKAEQVLRELLEKKEGNPFLWEIKGRLALALKNEGDAEGAFLKAVDHAPEFSKARYELGVLYTRQKRFPEAESMFKKVIEENSTYIDAHMMLGMVYQQQGNIDGSNTHYRAVVDLNPRNAMASNNLASNLADNGGSLDEALKFARKAQEVAPKDPRINDTLGWIYYKKGFIELALPLLAEAAERLPKDPVVRYHYGAVLTEKGETEKAKEELRAALDTSTTFHGAERAKAILETLK